MRIELTRASTGWQNSLTAPLKRTALAVEQLTQASGRRVRPTTSRAAFIVSN